MSRETRLQKTAAQRTPEICRASPFITQENIDWKLGKKLPKARKEAFENISGNLAQYLNKARNSEFVLTSWKTT